MPPPLPKTGLSELPLPQKIGARDNQHERQVLQSHLPSRPSLPPSQTYQSRSPPRTHERLFEAPHGIYERQSLPSVQDHESSVRETSAYVRHAQEMPAKPRATLRNTISSGPESGFEHPRVTDYDEAYGPLAGQGRVQHRWRPRARMSATQDPHRAAQSAEYATPERQRAYVPEAVTRSPFFQRTSLLAAPDAARSANRLGERLQGFEQGPPIGQMPNVRLHARERAQVLPVLTQRHIEHQHQAPYQPRTPLHPQGFFQRQSRPPTFELPQTRRKGGSNNIRNRVSLPPSSDRAPVLSFGDQDGALSRIRGVRGLTSRQSQRGGLAPSPTFVTPRQVFSAAGSRRSVRR